MTAFGHSVEGRSRGSFGRLLAALAELADASFQASRAASTSEWVRALGSGRSNDGGRGQQPVGVPRGRRSPRDRLVALLEFNAGDVWFAIGLDLS